MALAYAKAIAFAGKGLTSFLDRLTSSILGEGTSLLWLPAATVLFLLAYMPLLALIPADSLLGWRSPAEISEEVNQHFTVP